MPNIIVYVEPLDGYGDFCHLRDIADWLKKTYPTYHVIPVCAVEGMTFLSEPRAFRLLSDFEELGWEVGDPGTLIHQALSQVSQLPTEIAFGQVILSCKDKPWSDSMLGETDYVIPVSTNQSIAGMIRALSKSKTFKGKVLGFLEHGEDIVYDELLTSAERAFVNKLKTQQRLSISAMGLAESEVGFMLKEVTRPTDLVSIKDKAFLNALCGEVSAALLSEEVLASTLKDMTIVPTYYQNAPKLENEALSHFGALFYTSLFVLSILRSQYAKESLDNRTLTVCVSGASMIEPKAMNVFLKRLIETLTLKDTSIKCIQSIKKTKEETQQDTVELNKDGITLRLVSGYFLSHTDRQIFVENTSGLMGSSGDKSLEECIQMGGLPLAQVRSFKINMYKNIKKYLDEKGSSEEIAGHDSISQYLEAILIVNEVLAAESLEPKGSVDDDDVQTKLLTLSKGIGERIDSHLLASWEAFSHHIRENQNAYEVLRQRIESGLPAPKTLPDLGDKRKVLFFSEDVVLSKAFLMSTAKFSKA